MSKKSRLMSALLAFALVVSFFTPKAFAYKVSDDVADTKYHEAATVLGALNIMVGDDTGLFRPEDGVTRAEFSKIAVHILGIEDASAQSQGISKFPDVAKDHWANGYINVASSQKIIVGDDTGLFRPDDKISYQEAITILVRVLGYEHMAISKGGYPTGYIITGSDTGLTKKTQSVGTEVCTRGTTAQMTFNALTINLMEAVGFSTDNKISYQVTDKTLLKDKLNVEKGTGVVTGNELTRLENGLALKENQIEINGEKVYKTVNGEGKTLLGYNVIYYVKEMENGDKSVILAYKDNSKNDEMNISVQKLSQEIKEDSTSIFYEDEDQKEEELVLEDDKVVIYNDKYQEKLVNPKAGYIKLLDTDSNDKYDVVFIDEYENYVTDRVSLTGKKIYDKNGKSALDLNKDNNRNLVVTITDVSGAEVKLEDIKEWDILSVFKNTNYLKVVVSKDFVTGKISELSPQQEIVVIDGKEYSPASGFDFKHLTLDLEGAFYLDMHGDIAAIDAEYKKGSNYAYLINAGLDSGLDTSLSVKVFTSEGNVETLKVADKVKIDDKTNYDPSNAYKELLTDGKIAPVIFAYETNAKGEISLIDRAENKTSAFPASFEDIFALNYVGSDMVFSKGNGYFAKVESNITKATVGVDEDTIIFAVAKDEKDTEKMEMMTFDMLSDGGKYDIEVFDMSEDMTARVIRITNQISVGKLSAPLAVVDKITSVYNQEGDKTDKIYVYYNGERKEFIAKDDTVLVKDGNKKLESGDIITFTQNAKEEIDSVSVIFDIKSKTTEFAKEYGNSGEMVVVYGKVTGKFANSINLSVDGKSAVNYKVESPVVYRIDTNKTTNKISLSEFGDISKWEDQSNEERVLVRIYEDKVTEMIIVK